MKAYAEKEPISPSLLKIEKTQIINPIRKVMHSPTRRNRNIGTAKQGYGQDNRMHIPESWHDSYLFYEKLNHPVKLTRIIGGKRIMFLIEPPLDDYRHTCTVDDICYLLSYVPSNDWAGLDIIVLRQPTRNQKILSSVWGRLAYFYETKSCSGVAVILESQPIGNILKWSKSLDPDAKKEIERLAKDGHEVNYGKKCITIKSTIESCRNTMLFRTLLHEIGHYCHYQKVNDSDRYDSICKSEKEAAAHRYADELACSLTTNGKIPFDQILDTIAIKENNMAVNWFM